VSSFLAKPIWKHTECQDTVPMLAFPVCFRVGTFVVVLIMAGMGVADSSPMSCCMSHVFVGFVLI
jgi:hypothetical protein